MLGQTMVGRKYTSQRIANYRYGLVAGIGMSKRNQNTDSGGKVFECKFSFAKFSQLSFSEEALLRQALQVNTQFFQVFSISYYDKEFFFLKLRFCDFTLLNTLFRGSVYLSCPVMGKQVNPDYPKQLSAYWQADCWELSELRQTRLYKNKLM